MPESGSTKTNSVSAATYSSKIRVSTFVESSQAQSRTPPQSGIAPDSRRKKPGSDICTMVCSCLQIPPVTWADEHPSCMAGVIVNSIEVMAAAL